MHRSLPEDTHEEVDELRRPCLGHAVQHLRKEIRLVVQGRRCAKLIEERKRTEVSGEPWYDPILSLLAKQLLALEAEEWYLLEALVDELIDAHDHFRLHQDLDAAILDYQADSTSLSAHMDAALLRLCKASDLYEGKPSLNLRNFLETIEGNAHFFDEPNFRQRLKNNPFFESLAADPRKADSVQLQKDLKSVSNADSLVKKLTIWRNNYFAHRSRSSALDPKGFAKQNSILFSEIKALIDNGLRIVNFYSSLFSASVHTSLPVEDYKYLLDAVRRDLKVRDAELERQIAAAKAASCKA